jgi:broad specificity phosphatase PhoE
VEKLVTLIARHGRTQGNQAHIFRSRMDFPLDQEGEQDAQELGQHIAGRYPVKLIVTSPMKRAERTAQTVGQHIGTPVERDGRLLPWHAGLLTGKKRTAKSEAVRDYYVQHPDSPIPGGESIAGSEQRFKGVLDAAIRHGQQGNLPLLSTHGSGLKAAETLISGKRTPTGDAAMVEPGGLAGVFHDEQKGLSIRPLFKQGNGQVTS